jgi:acyl-CoA reductase-like NAD-dependent aldehyde dehydrogenase
VILDDYDIATAAASLSVSATRMTGQTCASITRIIVNKNRHDDFVAALSAGFAEVQVGDPHRPHHGDTRWRCDASEIAEHYIAKGIEEGAELATGGRRPPDLARGFASSRRSSGTLTTIPRSPARDLRPRDQRDPRRERATRGRFSMTRSTD